MKKVSICAKTPPPSGTAEEIVFWDSPLARRERFVIITEPYALELGRFLVFAGVAQLAEHDVANVVVEGSNPFARS